MTHQSVNLVFEDRSTIQKSGVIAGFSCPFFVAVLWQHSYVRIQCEHVRRAYSLTKIPATSRSFFTIWNVRALIGSTFLSCDVPALCQWI